MASIYQERVLKSDSSFRCLCPPTPGINHTSIKGDLLRHCEKRDRDSLAVVIYPSLGNTWVAIEYIAQRLDIFTLTNLSQTVSSPLITERTKSLGISQSQEGVCFPYKAILGGFIEGMEKFEELKKTMAIRQKLYPFVLYRRGPGACREGTYGYFFESTLNGLNPDFDLYISMESLDGIGELISILSTLSGKGKWETIRAVNEGIKRLRIIEELEAKVKYIQCLVSPKDIAKADEIFSEAQIQMASGKKISQTLKKAASGLEKLPRIKEKPEAIIAITGEIFQCEEVRTVSMDIERLLIKEGFYPVKQIGVAFYAHKMEFTPQRLLNWALSRTNPFEKDLLKEAALRAGVHYDVGGHGLHTIALVQEIKEALAKREKTYDGVVEISPFGCLPQTMAANIIGYPGFPFLRFACDEQTGKTGVVTRIEAFMDNVKSRRKLEEKREKVVFDRSRLN